MSQTNKQTTFFSIDISSILFDLKRHWWNILLVLLGGALLGYAFSTVYIKPVYTSSTVIAVQKNSSSAVANVQSASKLSGSIIGVLNSQALKSIVSENVKSTDYILQVEYITDTNLIKIQSSAATPELAFNSLNQSMENYPALMSDLMADVHTVTVQRPQIPTNPVNSGSVSQITLASAAICVVGYAALVVLLSLLRDTVKNTSDMREKVDARLIGKVPYVKEAGALLQTSHGQNFQFEEHYQITASRIMAQLDMTEKKVVAVTSVLQNEGKTHCLLNLAYSMAKGEKKVLVIDGDFHNPSIANLLNTRGKDENALAKALQTGEFSSDMLYKVSGCNVYCLTNTKANINLSNSVADGKFATLLRFAKNHFDYILVDTGPVGIVSDASVLVSQCDSAVLLVAQDTASIKLINDTIDVLEQNGTLLGCVYREVRPDIAPVRAYGSNSYGYRYRYAVESRKNGGEK